MSETEKSRVLFCVDKESGGGVDGMSAEEQWAYFFKYGNDKTKRKEINEILRTQEAITMAAETLLTISKDENERALLLSRETYELDRQSHLVNAKHAGRREGLQEGMQQGLWETAIAAKREGVGIDLIAKITGLSSEEIANL
jgi:predicted transposase/invertase (TIGR01784 family)